MQKITNRPINNIMSSILIAVTLILLICLGTAGADGMPQFHAFLGTVSITSESANIRIGPDSKAERLEQAEEGDSFFCSGKTENNWYELILRDGRTAYVSCKMSSLEPEGNGEEIIQLDYGSGVENAIRYAVGKSTATREDFAAVTKLLVEGSTFDHSASDWELLTLLPNLTELTIDDINMDSYALQEAPAALQILSISWCDNVPWELIGAFSELTSLTLNNKENADLSLLAGFTKLTKLRIVDNNMTDLSPLAGLNSLTVLDLSLKQLTDISPLAGLTNLVELNLYSGNPITDLSPLAGMRNITVLSLRSNEITDCSVLAGMQSLTNLDLGNNEIADIGPLAGLTNLVELHLDENQITDITPLKGLINLKTLSLSFNPVTDITSLGGLTALRELSLYDLELENYDALVALTGLQELSCDTIVPGGMSALDTLFEAGVEIISFSPYTTYASGDFNDVKVTIHTQGSGALFYYVDFQSMSDGGPNGYAYVHAGDSVNVFLPPEQSCRVIFSCGKPSDWIDREHAFGDNGEYYRMDTVFTPKAGYSYEITLYGVSDGNTSSTRILNPYQ